MKQAGLTLIEMLTVLGIVSVLVMAAIPPIISWKAKASLRGIASQMIVSLQRARNYSLVNSEYTVIRFKAGRYEIFSDNGEGGACAGDWIRSGTERMLLEKDYPAGTTLSSTFYNDRFRFKGFGRNQPGTITLSSAGGGRINIVVNVVGRVRAEYG